MNDKTRNFFKASIDVLPLLIPVVPFGIIFGAIGIELGFGPYATYATSIIIFSGASQIVFFQLLSAGASSIVAITSCSVISTRHFLYGAVVNQYLSNLSIYWKIGLSYILTDQAFAVSNNYFKKNKKSKVHHYHLLGSGLTCWTIWQISTIVGIVLGSVVPEELGLQFAIPITFLALLINDFTKIKHVIVMFVSGLIATLGYLAVPFKAYIIVAALSALLVAALLTNIKINKR